MFDHEMDRAKETNGLNRPDAYHKSVTHRITRLVSWKAKGLRITRLRLIGACSQFPFWDVSYCHGFIKDEPVRVALPFGQLPRFGFQAAIIVAARKDGVYAKGLGVFNAISTLGG